MESDKLSEFQKEQMALAHKSYGLLGESASKIQPILGKLEKISEEINEHIQRGDLSNQTRNSELWHNLNNVEHQIKQFTHYTESSAQDIFSVSKKLIENLRSLRPPKPTE